MELRITEQKENKLTDRIEVVAKLSFTGATPSNVQVADSIASQMKSKPELVVVKKIDTAYGYTEAVVTAFVYTSPESKEKYEPRLGKKAVEKIKNAAENAKKKAEEAKAAAEEAKKAEEEAKAAPAEEAPAEEAPAEEAPVEEKKEE